jgi:hypothetical protein
MILLLVSIASFHLAFGNPVLPGAVNIETPPYDVVTKGTNYEVRFYHSQLWAQVDYTVDPSTNFNDKTSIGFEPLFQYITGKNDRQLNIPMTAPVVMQILTPNTGNRRMAFIMPASQFSTLDQLPKPNNPNVTIAAVNQPLLFACITFDMDLTSERVLAREAELRETTKADGIELVNERQYVRVGDYNPPWTLPWLRKNEICIALVSQI